MPKPDKYHYRSQEPEAAGDDEYRFRLSDETLDRGGDIIVQAGWKLAEFRRNPMALFGHSSHDVIGTWKDVKVDGKQLVGTLKLAEAGTSDVVDTVRSLLRQGILKTVSVGFIPKKYEAIDEEKGIWAGARFLESTLLECSVVAVPANPNALQLRSMPSSVQAIFAAESGILAKSLGLTRAEPGTPKPKPKAKTMSLAERIASTQAELLRVKDAMIPFAKKVDEEEDLSDEELEEFDGLQGEEGTLAKKLSTLRATEKTLGRQTAAGAVDPPARTTAPGAPASPAINQIKVGRVNERPADLITKLTVLHLLSQHQRLPLEVVRMQRYGDRDDLDAIVKATTNPALTTVSGWAAELVDSATLDFMETLLPVSAYAALAAKGIRFSFGRNGLIKIPRRNKIKRAPGDLRAAWVGEGAPIPVRRGSIGMASFTPKKVGVISTWSREIANHSTPQIETIIREGIVEDTADTLDETLLGAQAGTAAMPAGLLFGVTPIPASTAGGIEAVQADVAAAVIPFVQGNAVDRLVWLINPVNLTRLSMMTTPIGIAPTLAQEAAQGRLAGYDVISSTSVPVDALILVRYADFASALGDEPEWDVSDQAVVHEDDGTYPAAPDNTAPTVLPIVDGAGVVAKPVRSLWQTASFGIRMIMDVDFAMRRTGMVGYVQGIDWTTHAVTP